MITPQNNSLTILGIDPGSRITGFGLIQAQGNRLIHLENGLVDLRKINDWPTKLSELYQKLSPLISLYQPSVMALESIFYAKNVASTLKLGQLRGGAIMIAGLKQLRLAEYSPLEIKQAVVGYGRAAKEQVQKMVRVLLNLPEVCEENAADALAAAICYAQKRSFQNKINPNKNLTTKQKTRLPLTNDKRAFE